MTSSTKLRPDLDLDAIRRAADDTAESIRNGPLGTTVVEFHPGDATTYEFAITRAASLIGETSTQFSGEFGGLLVVLLSPGCGAMTWQPRAMNAGYGDVDRLTIHQHTAEVVAAFLTLLAEAVGS
jgi:hypothetical protein